MVRVKEKERKPAKMEHKTEFEIQNNAKGDIVSLPPKIENSTKKNWRQDLRLGRRKRTSKILESMLFSSPETLFTSLCIHFRLPLYRGKDEISDFEHIDEILIIWSERIQLIFRAEFLKRNHLKWQRDVRLNSYSRHLILNQCRFSSIG